MEWTKQMDHFGFVPVFLLRFEDIYYEWMWRIYCVVFIDSQSNRIPFRKVDTPRKAYDWWNIRREGGEQISPGKSIAKNPTNVRSEDRLASVTPVMRKAVRQWGLLMP